MKKFDATRWRVCREFHSAEWPDGAVVYDMASGDTHHLTPAAVQILHLIHDSPCTLKALATRALSSNAATPDQESLVMIEAIVTDLSKLGFIEPEQH